jgi:hypothetical protein
MSFSAPKKTGGQHQGSNSPVTWPVDFVTAMVIDGKVINLVNFWKHDDINAGDDLMLYVEDRPSTEYVLSHHPKNMKKQVCALPCDRQAQLVSLHFNTVRHPR